MSQTDREHFAKLLECRHPCVSIITAEESYALLVAREAAVEAGREMWVWSMIGGLRDGLIQDGLMLSDTEHRPRRCFGSPRTI